MLKLKVWQFWSESRSHLDIPKLFWANKISMPRFKHLVTLKISVNNFPETVFYSLLYTEKSIFTGVCLWTKDPDPGDGSGSGSVTLVSGLLHACYYRRLVYKPECDKILPVS